MRLRGCGKEVLRGESGPLAPCWPLALPVIHGISVFITSTAPVVLPALPSPKKPAAFFYISACFCFSFLFFGGGRVDLTVPEHRSEKEGVTKLIEINVFGSLSLDSA